MNGVAAPVLLGVEGFISDLNAEGCGPLRDGATVTYYIVPTSGAFSGATIRTGVNVEELAQWPTVPPHWLHFEAHIKFERTNADATGCLPGWLKHSRDIGPWDSARPPIVTWLAHVRGVAGEAT